MALVRTLPFPHPGGPDVLVVSTVHVPAPRPEAPGRQLRTRMVPAPADIVGLLPYGVPARMLEHPPVLPLQAPHLASALPLSRTVVLL